MSDPAESRAASGKVKELATEIDKAQGPEIKTMSGMDHGDSGSSEMPGMMDQKQMDKLKKASGKNFDTQFLTMMGHHKGAVEMAETEKKEGKYGPAKDLADEVITTRQARSSR